MPEADHYDAERERHYAMLEYQHGPEAVRRAREADRSDALSTRIGSDGPAAHAAADIRARTEAKRPDASNLTAHRWGLVADEDPDETEVCTQCGAQRNRHGRIEERARISGGWPNMHDCDAQEAVLVAADRLAEAYTAMLEGRDVGSLPEWQPRESSR